MYVPSTCMTSCHHYACMRQKHRDIGGIETNSRRQIFGFFWREDSSLATAHDLRSTFYPQDPSF